MRIIKLLLLFSVAVNCSLRKRGLETPVPSEQVQEKTFFFNAGDVNKPKRFLLGSAPIQTDASGEGWETYLAQDDLHINIEFEVTETKLIGLQVNPSFPNDRSKWSKVLEIPITKHYYNEFRKDEYGRDTREMIENDQRSHWSRRTHMKLDLTGVQFFVERTGHSMYSRRSEILSVDGIEWDQKSQFLGFNINERVTFTYGLFVRNSLTANVTRRFNILAFESDKNFKATPYHTDNAKYFNILHTVSRQIEEGGSVDRQIMKAAKWDFSKPLDIYLDGVPEKYTQLFKDTVNAWGNSLQKIGAVPQGMSPFNVRTDYPSKYPFDLRYPAIHWVDSKRTSLFSPLGIALNNADVETGKMLSANVIMYGGMLERLVNRYLNPTAASASAIHLNSQTLFPPFQFQTPQFSQQIKMDIDKISGKLNANVAKNLQVVQEALKLRNTPESEAKIQELDQQLTQLANGSDQRWYNILRDLPNMPMDSISGAPRLNEMENQTQSFLSQTKISDLLSLDIMAEDKEMELLQMLSGERFAAMKDSALLRGATNIVAHDDRTFAHAAPLWMSSLANIPSNRQEAALRSLLRNVLLHEMGHFLGLGHQFKGSIVPEAGTLPKEYTNHKDNLKNPKSLLSRSLPENNSNNYSSIMDYANGRGEVLIEEADVVPGPHDELVLNYIYNGKIAVFNKQADKFEFFKHEDVNEQYSGYIPEKYKGHKVAYFPACNDYDASFLKDPQCNRWDSGSLPVDIVKSYTRNIDDSISNILFNFTDANETSAFQAENRLWYLSFDVFAHLRTFYEQLRLKLAQTAYDKNSANSVSMWDKLRTNETALFEFSRACTTETDKISNEILKTIMKNKAIKDLCLANIEALSAIKKYVSLPPIDHTRLEEERNIQGGYIAGEGTKQWAKYFDGGWLMLSNRPLKTVALLNATTATPFMIYGGSLMNNFFFDYEGNRFLYRTLFPEEVTEVISTAVNKNLMFASEESSTLAGESKTLIGSAILSLSYFNWNMNNGPYAGNEKSRLSENYDDILKSQTAFDFNYGAVIITAVPPTEGESDRFKKFTVSLYDFSNDKSTKIEDFFILREGRIIARDNNKFLFPLTKIRFFSDTEAYALVYKIGYDELRERDPLIDKSVKTHLTDLHKKIVDDCVIGENNSGLASYFSGAADSTFAGFKIPQGISTETNNSRKYEFDRSVNEEFDKYELYAKKKNPNLKLSMTYRCEEAVRGVGMISSVAAMLNGYWLGITNNYVER